MQTFTVIDGVAYRGTLHRGHRIVWARGGCAMDIVASYLSADLGNFGFVSIEQFSEDEESAPSNDELREKLTSVIVNRLASGNVGKGIRRIWIVWRHGEGGDPPEFVAAYDGVHAEEQANACAKVCGGREPYIFCTSPVELWPLLSSKK